jgi:hypothetical protein
MKKAPIFSMSTTGIDGIYYVGENHDWQIVSLVGMLISLMDFLKVVSRFSCLILCTKIYFKKWHDPLNTRKTKCTRD